VAGVGAGTVRSTDVGAGAATLLTVALAAGLLVAWALRRAFGRRQPALAGATWACGYAVPSPRMAYTASSFAAPLLGAFRSVAGVRTDRTAYRLATHVIDPVLDRVILPAWHGVRTAATGLRAIHRGALSRYLVYVVAAVVTVLLYLMAAGGTP
jgi:hypothetical protein